MRIESILRTKGEDVATIMPGATVPEAVAALAERGIGALVVSSDGSRIEGILSERDLARGLARHGSGVVELTVRHLMTGEVTTCVASDTVDHLMATMTDHRIRHVPVVDDDRLVGIVSIGDIVKSRLGELEQENTTLHDYIASGR
jgi:CBS domain-containing protein